MASEVAAGEAAPAPSSVPLDELGGWPFILAVRGPTGRGLTRAEIIETFERRLENDAEAEFEECLRNVHRIAELRLADRFSS